MIIGLKNNKELIVAFYLYLFLFLSFSLNFKGDPFYKNINWVLISTNAALPSPPLP